jgi:ribokinase
MDSPIVLVAGSLHYDVVVTADRLPVLDETLPGTSVSYLCGGKGSNQAVAAARHGAPTALAGVVGDDAFGKVLIDNLDHAGVDRSAVVISPGANSGMSVAIVTGDGEYGAVIVSAANLKIDATSVEIPDTVQVVLLQNEIPEKANVVLAPARPLEAVVRSRIDLLTVNRVEAAALCGRTVETVADAIAAARTLAADGCDTIVTLGSGGAVFAIANGEPRHFPAPPVEARSTHGAGDAFVGALAARLALGADLPVALHYAQMAAALHVSYARDERESITTETVLARLGEV